MKIEIKGLGPIKEEANVELGDLTVFFGPPNSGKSTVLKALYYSLNLPELDFIRKSEKTLTNYILDINYEIEQNVLHFSFSPSYDFVKYWLPKGEFSVKPFSFIDFMRSNAIYSRKIRDRVDLPNIVAPQECAEAVKLVLKQGVEFEAEIDRNSGYVRILLELDKQCGRYLYRELGEEVIKRLGKEILSKFKEEFWRELYEKEEIRDVVFIPYHRSLLTFEGLEIINQIKSGNLSENKVMGAIGLASAFSELLELVLFFQRILKPPKIKEGKILALLEPLIPGDLKVDESGIYYIEGNEVIDWRFVSASIMEALSLLLAIREGELVLYEEPETQLHEKLQVLMGLILYALTTTNKLVITTHSQTILYTLSFLAYLKPTKEEIRELLESLGIKNERLAEAVEEANKKLVKFYYFHDGRVEEKAVSEVVEGIPGVTDVMDKELKWFSKLYLSRVGKNAGVKS